MKILVVDDEGTVIGTVEDLQDYNLDRGFARVALIDEIKEILSNK